MQEMLRLLMKGKNVKVRAFLRNRNRESNYFSLSHLILSTLLHLAFLDGSTVVVS